MSDDFALTAADTGVPLTLDEVARIVADDRWPPVESWDPPHRGHSGIRIDAAGSWHHEGRPIERRRLVRMFSRILRRDGDAFMLVTPVEKLTIDVEDAPFLAVEVEADNGGLYCRLSTGDMVVVPAPAAIRLKGDIPYVTIKRELDARISRSAWYELADRLDEHDPSADGSPLMTANGRVAAMVHIADMSAE